MQTLVIGFAEDEVHHHLTSVSIRLSYLLSDQFRLAGNHHTFFHIEEGLRASKVLDKLRFITEKNKGLTDQDREMFRELEKVFKNVRKMKDRQKNLLVQYKISERAVNEQFEHILQHMMRPLRTWGLLNIAALEEKPGYRFYPVRYLDTEKVEPGVCLLSEILQLHLDEEDNELPTTLFLNYPFFDTEFETNHSLSIPHEDKFSEHGFLIHLMDFHDITVLTVADMDTLKMEADKALKNFQQSFDYFISLKSEPPAAFDYLQQHLKSSAANLHDALNTTMIMQNYNQNVFTGTSSANLFAGMLPWKTVYEYYKYIKVIKGKTLEIIDSITPPHEWMPVLILKLSDSSNVIEQSEAEENKSHTLKKSLDL